MRHLFQRRILSCLALAVSCLSGPRLAAQSYIVETIQVPKNIRLEVGGMGY